MSGRGGVGFSSAKGKSRKAGPGWEGPAAWLWRLEPGWRWGGMPSQGSGRAGGHFSHLSPQTLKSGCIFPALLPSLARPDSEPWMQRGQRAEWADLLRSQGAGAI